MGYWQDKVVMVVGGSTGFGKVLAQELVAERAKVILVARDEARLMEAASDLDQTGSSVIPAILDVSDESAVVTEVEKCIVRFQRLDAVFNCVGRSTRERVMDVDAEQMRSMIEINLNTIVNVARAVVPELAKTSGHLVHIGSLAAKTAWPWVTSYSVSKSAMATYTHQLRLEGPSSVHYLLVCPGPIARTDTGTRYEAQTKNLPEQAKAGGAGAKLKGIDPQRLAQKILRSCVKRRAELIVPGYARIAFVASAISPALGDWILRRKMSR